MILGVKSVRLKINPQCNTAGVGVSPEVSSLKKTQEY